MWLAGGQQLEYYKDSRGWGKFHKMDIENSTKYFNLVYVYILFSCTGRVISSINSTLSLLYMTISKFVA